MIFEFILESHLFGVFIIVFQVPPALHNLGKINHVAVAVPDLNNAIKFYRDVLGGNVTAPEVPLSTSASCRCVLSTSPSSRYH